MSLQSTETTNIVKATYIYNFCKLIDWPSAVKTGDFKIGVVMDENLYNELLRYKDEKIGTQNINIELVQNLDSAKSFHVLYTTFSNGYKASELFDAIGDKPVLLVTSDYLFNQTMINFIEVDNSLKFKLNVKNIKSRQIIVGTRLKDLAFQTNSYTEEEWIELIDEINEELSMEKVKSNQLDSLNELLSNNLIALDSEIDSLNVSIEIKKDEVNKLSIEFNEEKSALKNLTNDFTLKEKDLRESQLLLDQKNNELDSKKLEISISEKLIEEKTNELNNLNSQYETERAKLNRTQSLLEDQKLISIGLIVVAVLIGLLGILAFHNFRKQKKQSTIISQQRDAIQSKNKELTDSITYAKRIQAAILPPDRIVKEYLEDSFVIYKPKDIVAGDFYWLEHKSEKIFFAVADCTGHGVPGAMVSVVCHNALNRAVNEFQITEPGKILDKVREIVVQEFEKSDDDVKDGMDIAICTLEGKKLEYSGAYNPLWIIRNNELIETKANKQPIGKVDNPKRFTNHSFELKRGDTLYVFSDGYVDQFGGENDKKFKVKVFREMILNIQDNTMKQQMAIINSTFDNWKGELEQVDDVCIIGVRV